MKNVRTKFSENLVTFRKEKRLSQEELATKVFVTRQSISKWETGESVPDMTNLVQLALILDRSLDELVLGIQSKTNSNIGKVIEKLFTQDAADKDWHQEHRWRQWQYSNINNGWEWLARYYWVLFALIGIIGWLVFEFFGKTMW